MKKCLRIIGIFLLVFVAVAAAEHLGSTQASFGYIEMIAAVFGLAFIAL
jgi:hypothetical protein